MLKRNSTAERASRATLMANIGCSGIRFHQKRKGLSMKLIRAKSLARSRAWRQALRPDQFHAQPFPFLVEPNAGATDVRHQRGPACPLRRAVSLQHQLRPAAARRYASRRSAASRDPAIHRPEPKPAPGSAPAGRLVYRLAPNPRSAAAAQIRPALARPQRAMGDHFSCPAAARHDPGPDLENQGSHPRKRLRRPPLIRELSQKLLSANYANFRELEKGIRKKGSLCP